jgi:hypothetical protein
MGDGAPGATRDTDPDIGIDDAHEVNLKRIVDDYANLSLDGFKRSQNVFDQTILNSGLEHGRLASVALQALQNAVETANMVSKQAVRHGDIAIDNQWNPVTEGAGNTLTARAVSIDDASLKAIGAAIAAALAQALNPAPVSATPAK